MKDGSSSLTLNKETAGKGTVLSHGNKGEGGGGVVGIVEKANTDVVKDMPIGDTSLSQHGIFQGEKDRGMKEWKDEKYESTRLAFRTGMVVAYESSLEASEHDSIAVFHHLGGHTFLVRFCKVGSELEDFEEDHRPSHR